MEKKFNEMTYEEQVEFYKEFFNNLNPFNGNINNIPELPLIKSVDYDAIVVPNLIRCGAIPIDQMEKDSYYEGSCRNTSYAKWDGEKFVYERHKFNLVYEDSVNHFQDDDGFDVFVPIKKV